MHRLGLFTGSGIVGAALVPLLVVAMAFASGGDIFSSGPLNADQGAASIGGAWSHADLACGDCHTPFWSATRMGDRCLACHTDIAEQLAQPTSLHAGIASAETCRKCHPEHRGSHGTLTLYAPDLYPHAEFGFFLLSHLKMADGRAFTCSDCHVDTSQAFTQDTCIGCHQTLDSSRMATHTLDFGVNCLACHDGIDTFGKRFDHQAAAFPLEGQHLSLACSNCHAGASDLQALRATPAACAACHAADDAHQGSLGSDCSGCHTPQGWDTAQLDHNQTAFPLVGRHVPLACEQCHAGGKLSGIPTTCLECHRDDDSHAGKLGPDCETCHTPEDWSIIIDGNFDHGRTGFSLTGAHGRVATCTACHRGGRFAGTPTDCAGCHAADDPHAGGFGKDCSACHSTNAWLPATFSHSGQTNCASCHTKIKPANHFAGQCSQCHSTSAWKPATFNHTGQTDCASCHTGVRPANHPSGQCSQCHSTTAWKPATFNHAGLTDCASCHTNIRPANHPSGQCSQCHTTTAWKPATFNHAGLTDCASCHANVKPANHFAGQCSQCHTTTAWKPATFNHTGLTDCASCHTNVKPANHFAGQCSQCHTTSAWKPATFNHSGLTDCASCHTNVKPANHFAGQCSQCHTTSAWKPATFSHSGLTDCASCHTSVKPANHYAGQCSQCHTTSAWKPATFNHSGLTDCASCHTNVKPANHFAGQCSQCHTTSAWKPATFSHSGLTDCASCHTNVKPANHFAGQCSQCHSTSAWTPATFSHSGLTDCQSCHSGNRPGSHYSGQCSACHSTSAWKPALKYSHSSGNFPSGHRSSVTCGSCHTSKTDAVNWSSSSYKPDCAGCHAGDWKDGPHEGATVSDLRNCSGACHEPGPEHRTSDREW